MAIQEHDPRWWSDIVQTEIRLPHRCSCRLCILPLLTMSEGSSRMAAARKTANALVMKVRAFFAHQPPATSIVSCGDPAEAYMGACIAASLFCYVSPAIYGLIGTIGERGVTQRTSRRGDEA